jgi:hypothetical protein
LAFKRQSKLGGRPRSDLFAPTMTPRLTIIRSIKSNHCA